MQTTLSTLPKLDNGRDDPQTTPKVGNRDVILALELVLNLLHPALELGATVILAALRFKHLALTAGPGADTAPAHAGVEVDLALLL